MDSYGSQTFRPHYHLCLFGLSADDMQVVRSCWNFGHVQFGDITVKSVQYVCGYVQKKLYGKVADEVYFFRSKPFQLQSKGLGLDFFGEHALEILDRNGFLVNGHYLSVPRYYLKKDEDFKTLYDMQNCNLNREQSVVSLLDFLENQEEIMNANRQKEVNDLAMRKLRGTNL